MTKKQALTKAIELMNTMDNTSDIIDVFSKMIEQLDKRGSMSDEKKAAMNAARHEKTVAARIALIEQVVPILRKYLAEDVTAKELFESAKDELPEGFTAPKVQNILLRELAPELIKTETKGKANTYRLA